MRQFLRRLMRILRSIARHEPQSISKTLRGVFQHHSKPFKKGFFVASGRLPAQSACGTFNHPSGRFAAPAILAYGTSNIDRRRGESYFTGHAPAATAIYCAKLFTQPRGWLQEKDTLMTRRVRLSLLRCASRTPDRTADPGRDRHRGQDRDLARPVPAQVAPADCAAHSG
jgi:hypothetical protein